MGGHQGHDHSHAVVTEGNAKKLTIALVLTTTIFNRRSYCGFNYTKFGIAVRCSAYVY